ncbi:hypothetical protein [Lentzea sp. NEAU-D7]|uniref:hypothetical protein n=1 Tax=Lentzea sp. NEAU-D7 TaxID=2994667 RepID=UPI00224B3F6B|nr:hypothetical protein [Lentzea sp. NEAU-D7]MCX2955324.1 hypothetical protein [Lentzea sp. NEAU-D7]
MRFVPALTLLVTFVAGCAAAPVASTSSSSVPNPSLSPAPTSKSTAAPSPSLTLREFIPQKIGEQGGLNCQTEASCGLKFVVESIETNPACGQYGTKADAGSKTVVLHVSMSPCHLLAQQTVSLLPMTCLMAAQPETDSGVPMFLRLFRSCVSAASAAVVLAGCSGQPAAAPAGLTTTTGSTTTAETAATITTTSPPSRAPHGPLLATCTATAVTLSTLDPATGVSASIAEFSAANSSVGATTGPKTTWSVCASGTTLSSYFARQVFTPDLDRMAVNLRVSETNSTHVGWIDATNGTMTDLTALLAGTGGGFTAQPQHSNAVFNQDGNFGYFDKTTNEFVWINPDTKAKLRSQKVENTVGKVLVMPDGSVSSNSSGLDRGMVLTIPMPVGGVLDSASSSPVVWVVDKSRGLQIGAPVNAPNTLGIKLAGPDDPSTEGQMVPITPRTDYVIRSAVSDPQAKTAIFTAERGKTLDVFQVPLDGSAQPAKVTTLPQTQHSVAFIGWK